MESIEVSVRDPWTIKLWLRLRAMLGPSLVRRLVWGQFCLIGFVIAAMLLRVFLSDPDDHFTFGGEPRMQMWLHSARSIADQPDKLQQQFAVVDEFLRHDNDTGDREDERITLSVHKRGELIYASPGRPGAMSPAPVGQITQRFQAAGSWLVLTQIDDTTGVSLTLSRRESMLHSLASWRGVQQLLVFLCAVLLLLLLPSWLALRWGLRPIYRLGEELHRRDPNDLRDLKHKARDRELRPVVDAVNGWLSRMRASQRRELDFVANAAHELRTPLAAIHINAEALSKLNLAPPASNLLHNLLQSSQRANRVAEQLLAALRNDADALNSPKQLVNLRRLIEGRMADLCIQADAKQSELNLRTDSSLWVCGHVEMLESMTDNLISNAIKYGPPKGRVWVNLTREGGEILLTVEDQGPGIPVDARETVFERFRRLPENGTFGAGLGLAITQTAVIAHGGRIRLDTAPFLGGLRVSIWLPSCAPPINIK